MKRFLYITVLLLAVQPIFASNLTVAHSILSNNDLMIKLQNIAQKEVQADQFLSIEVQSDNRRYQATLTFFPSVQTMSSPFRYKIKITGKSDGISILSVSKITKDSDGE